MGNQSTKQHHQTSGVKPKKFVHWKTAERPSPPGRPILIPISDQQPDVITLRWERPRSDGGSPVLGYIVEHRRLGSPHWVRSTPLLVTKTEVSISGLEPGWRYQFRTIAENVVGRSDPSELSDALTVTLQRNAITVPRFVSELKDTIAVENQRVDMRVAVVGQPPPEINWFKDGFEIFSSRRTKIVNDNDTSVLIIHQAALTDEGEIKCTATNRAGHVATRAKLKVEAPPKIRLPRQYEDGLIVEAEEVLRLKVAIAGQPPPAVVWNHEGENVRGGGRFELITTDKYSSLKIENIKRIDRGEYTIRAINKLGEDVASFLVTVTARPDPPGRIKLKMSFGRSATLTWTAPIDDGGCKIGNYIVEYYRVGWNVWLKASTTRQLTATLHDLIEGSEYKFRVKAENPYGVSEPSQESDVLFIPDPKRGITKPVRDAQSADKPVPPKRKNLSPLRNLLGVSKKDDEREKSPKSDRSSPSANPTFNPQLYENEDLNREMNYGTSDNALKRSPSKGGQQTVQDDVNRSPSPNVRNPANTAKVDEKKSPTPKLKNENSLSVNEKISQFLRRSPSPSRKVVAKDNAEENEKLESAEKDNADLEKSPKLVRKNSGRFEQINQKVQSLFRRSPSPCRFDQPSEPEADQTPEVEKSKSLQRSEEPVKLNVDQRAQPVLRLSPQREISAKSNQNGLESQPRERDIIQFPPNLQGPRLSLPNPTIEISPPKRDETGIQSDIDKRDEVHTSSEFMLVLYHNKKSKETEKQESFDLELEEALSPPPISYSSPDIFSDTQYLQEPILRRSASSTELLYERAMARFYEAVELEESGRLKKLNPSQDRGLHEPMRKKLGSMSEAERLSFEKRSSLRRKLSGDIPDNLASLKFDFKETTETVRKLSPVPVRKTVLQREDTEEYSADEVYKGDSLEYESDYTESTASSASEDSIEKFKIELMARTRSTSGELETYHPRRMHDPNFSPYRSPTPDEATIVLNKPVPLASPDFVPKPILKRPSSDNSIKDEGVSNGKNGKPVSPEPVKKDIQEKLENPKNFEWPQEKLEKSQEKIEKSQEKIEKSREKIEKSQEKLEKSEEKLEKSQDKLEKSQEKLQKPENGEKAVKSESNLAKGIKGFFKREKILSDPSLAKNEEEKNSKASTTDQNGNQVLVENKQQPITYGVQKPATKQNSLEVAKRNKLETSKSAEEEAKVVAEYYNDIVRELGTSRKSTVPIYLRGQSYNQDEEEEKQEKKKKTEAELEDQLLEQYMVRPRLSIVERLQVSHVQDKSKLAIEKPLIEAPKDNVKPPEAKSVREEKITFSPKSSEDNLSPRGSGDNLEMRGRRIIRVKVKKRVTSGSRSKNGSASDIASQKSDDSAPRRRTGSRTRVRTESKSPGPLGRKVLQKEPPPDIRLPLYVPPPLSVPAAPDQPSTPEEIAEEAQEKVRSTVNYLTDVSLFVFACWVYIFKDARLVLPILALMVYRQIGEALKDSIPDWLKRKKS